MRLTNLVKGFVLTAMLLGMNGFAYAGQFFIGAQATNIETQLDYTGGSEEYGVNPTRIELGWEENNLYFSVHILTSGSDTDIDPFAQTFETKLDTSYGFFVGGRGEHFYGALGLQTFDTTYTWVGPNISDSDNILTLGALLGGQFEITSGLFIYGDFSIYFGSADYPSFFSGDKPDFTALGFAGGLRYAF